MVLLEAGGAVRGGIQVTYRKRLAFFGVFDASVVTAAVLLGYLIRFDFEPPRQIFQFVPYVLIAHLLLILPALYAMKIYHRVWKYASVGELVSIIKAVTLAVVVLYVLDVAAAYFTPDLIVPRSIGLLSWALIIMGVGGSRFAWRMVRDSYLKLGKHHRNLLIIGAGGAGARVAKELKHSPGSAMYPVAFIDDDASRHKLEVFGLPILGGRDKIREVVENHDIQDIIIAIPSASRSEIASVIDICKSTKASVKILPSMTDLITGKVTVKAIRDVEVEDLLGRDPVHVDLSSIANYVTNQVVMVTGAGGSIGSELCRQIARFQPRYLLLLGHGENSIYEIDLELRRTYPGVVFVPVIADIQDRGRLEELFRIHQPAVIFHAAAHKHVPLMEANPEEAVKNNILGTRNVAECAAEFGASYFVMISSDKAVNPTSVMGVTKRVTEMIIQSLDRKSATTFVAVRFGNVLGSRGSVVPVFKRQIAAGGPVTVTHPEMIRYFMTIPEAVQLVIQAGALAQGGEIFILDMGQPVKIADLARDLIRLSGLTPGEDIEIRYTGIRPGEKLYEEILTSEEGTTATKHNRIFVGKPTEFSREELRQMIADLEQMVQSHETPHRDELIRQMLWKMVPTFAGVSAKLRLASST
jgi:FlaA1/EpsC-like NDP-sugar epimerase